MGLSTCNEVTVIFPLGVWLNSKKIFFFLLFTTTGLACRDVSGQSWDVLHEIHSQLTSISQDCPQTSLLESSGCQVTLACRVSQDCPENVPVGILWTLSHLSQDCPGMSLMGSSRHQITPANKDVPGQSWDVPHGILRTSSHPSLQGCPRTALGYPSWDPLDIKSPQLARMPQDSPGMSFMGSSGHQVTPACKDVPGKS